MSTQTAIPALSTSEAIRIFHDASEEASNHANQLGTETDSLATESHDLKEAHANNVPANLRPVVERFGRVTLLVQSINHAMKQMQEALACPPLALQPEEIRAIEAQVEAEIKAKLVADGSVPKDSKPSE